MLVSIMDTLPRQRAHDLDPNTDCTCPIFAVDKSSIRVAFLLIQILLVWLIIDQPCKLDKGTAAENGYS